MPAVGEQHRLQKQHAGGRAGTACDLQAMFLHLHNKPTSAKDDANHGIRVHITPRGHYPQGVIDQHPHLQWFSITGIDISCSQFCCSSRRLAASNLHLRIHALPLQRC